MNSLSPDETPVVTEQVVREVEQQTSQGLKPVTEFYKLPVVKDVFNAPAAAAVAKGFREFGGSQRGVPGDIVIGTSAIVTGRTLITADQRLATVMTKQFGPNTVRLIK